MATGASNSWSAIGASSCAEVRGSCLLLGLLRLAFGLSSRLGGFLSSAGSSALRFLARICGARRLENVGDSDSFSRLANDGESGTEEDGEERARGSVLECVETQRAGASGEELSTVGVAQFFEERVCLPSSCPYTASNSSSLAFKRSRHFCVNDFSNCRVSRRMFEV